MPVTLEDLQEAFPTAWELLMLCDPDFSSGEFHLYDWQLRILEEFSQPGIRKESPYYATVRAANGAGKDKTLIAPAALWLALTGRFATSVVTTASGQQLDRQTDRYIRVLAGKVNAYFGEEVVIINYRRYSVPCTESTIELFATDEPGRAEGWHPTVSAGRFGIFVSEAKTVSNEIHDALERCRGCSHRLDVSSPGPPIGSFYETCGDPSLTHHKITAFECPHITPEEIERTRVKHGEHSPFYLSSVMAEFAVTDEPVVIPRHLIDRLFKTLVPHLGSQFNTGGLDLALGGGAETTLTVVNGNKVITQENCVIPEETKLISHLESLFYQHKLHLPGSVINADAGGLGKPILQHLVSRGWKNIRFFFNQSSPADPLAYANLGTELWFNLKNLIENYQVIIPPDDKLVKQLSSRYFDYKAGSKAAILESKLKMRARGQPSPDRADALALAFADISYEEREENRPKNFPEISSFNAYRPQELYLSKIVQKEDKGKIPIPITGTANALSGLRKFPDRIREQLIEIYGKRN